MIVKSHKEPKCPPVDETVRKIYTHTMEYYSLIRKTKFCLRNKMSLRLNIENIMLTYMSGKDKLIYSMYKKQIKQTKTFKKLRPK